jgi:hypothetical protein
MTIQNTDTSVRMTNIKITKKFNINIRTCWFCEKICVNFVATCPDCKYEKSKNKTVDKNKGVKN